MLGPRPVRVAEDWQTLHVSSGLCLSHCPSLPVTTATDADGVDWYLLGVAVQTDPARAAPPVELATARTQEVQTLYRDWAGRWILIGEGRIHLDACGLLGCFYRVEGTSTTWASSSGALLARIPDTEPLRRPLPVIPHHGDGLNWYRTGINWYPPPRSRFEGVLRLLPSQILSLSPGPPNLSPRSLLSQAGIGEGYEEKLDFLENRLVTAFGNISPTGPLWIPLTGGVDSRLVVSLATHMGRSSETFTFSKPFGRMPEGDLKLPPLVSKSAGYEHRLIKGGRRSTKYAALFDEHTGKHCMDPDRHYVLHGQWDQIPRDATILPGNVFVLGHFRYAELHMNRLNKSERFSDDLDPHSSADEIASRVTNGFAIERYHRRPQVHRAGIRAWSEWAWAHVEEDLDWRDRFTIEQRLAGDLSSTEQALDLIGPTRVHLANCTAIVSALLSLPDQIKVTGQHHKDLIARLAPELLDHRFNPPDSRVNQVAVRVRKRLDQASRAPRKARRMIAGSNR